MKARNYTSCLFTASSLIVFAMAAPTSLHAALIEFNESNSSNVWTLPGGENLLASAAVAPAVPTLPAGYESYSSSNWSTLTDAVLGAPGEFATCVAPINGSYLTYSLDTSINAAGYDLTSFDSYCAWPDTGRDNQNFTIQYATVTDPGTFITIAVVNNAGGGNIATHTRLTDSTGVLAANVGKVRVLFDNQENGWVGYREFIMQGTPVQQVVTGSPLTWRGASGSGGNADWVSTPDSNWKLTSDGTPANFDPSSPLTFDASGTNPNITVAGGGITAYSLAFTNDLTKSYVIGGGSLTVTATTSAGLSVSGAGSVTLNGSNTINGFTVVDNGVLNLGNDSALGSSILKANGGVVRFKTATPGVGGLSGTSGSVLLGDASGPAATTLSLGSSNTPSVFSGIVSNAPGKSGSLIKIGSGTQTFNNAQTYNGTTTISAGTLKLGFLPAANFVNASFETTGSLGSGGFAYTPTGTGWSYTGAGISANNQPWVNTSPDGTHIGFIQDNGRISQDLTFPGDSSDVVISFMAANRPGFPPTGLKLQVDGETLASLPAEGFPTDAVFQPFSFPAISLSAGMHTISIVGNGTIGVDMATAVDSIDIAIDGVSAVITPGALPSGTALNLAAAGATFDLGSNSQTVASLTGVVDSVIENGTLTTGGANGSFAFDGRLGGTGKLAKEGTGNLTLTGNNAGELIVNAGTMTLTGVNTSSTTLNGGTLVFSDGSLGAGILTVNSGGTFNSGSHAITVSFISVNGGVAQFEASAVNVTSSPFTVDVLNGGTLNQTGGNFNMGGYARVIGGSTMNLSGGTSQIANEMLIGNGIPDGTVNISGSHVADWSGTRFDTGTTLVNLNSGGTLLTNVVNNTTSASATLRFDGGTLGVRNSGGLTIQQSVTVLIGDGGATIDTTNGGATTGQPLLQDGASSGGLTKTGDNLLILNAGGTYTGGTTLIGGRLRAGNESAFGTGAVTIGTGNYLMLWWNTGNSTMANDFILNGIGANRNGETKATIYADGAGGGFASFTLAGQITLNATSDVGGYPDNALDISGKITGPGGLTKSYSNKVTLSNASNDYAGDTTVNAGTLVVMGSAIPDTGRLVINGGKVEPTDTEIIDTLFFGGEQQVAGTWGSTTSSAEHQNDTYFSGSGVVSVTNGSVGGYGSWISGFGVDDTTGGEGSFVI